MFSATQKFSATCSPCPRCCFHPSQRPQGVQGHRPQRLSWIPAEPGGRRPPAPTAAEPTCGSQSSSWPRSTTPAHEGSVSSPSAFLLLVYSPHLPAEQQIGSHSEHCSYRNPARGCRLLPGNPQLAAQPFPGQQRAAPLPRPGTCTGSWAPVGSEGSKALGGELVAGVRFIALLTAPVPHGPL